MAVAVVAVNHEHQILGRRIGGLPIANQSPFHPLTVKQRLVAHIRLSVVTGHLHHHKGHLFVDEMVTQLKY
jgi:hypothetical protein